MNPLPMHPPVLPVEACHEPSLDPPSSRFEIRGPCNPRITRVEVPFSTVWRDLPHAVCSSSLSVPFPIAAVAILTVGKVSTDESVQNFSHYWVVPSTCSTDTF
jgi:hypothetical protein